MVTIDYGMKSDIVMLHLTLQNKIASFFQRLFDWLLISEQDGISERTCRDIAQQQGFCFPNSYFTVFSVHFRNPPLNTLLTGDMKLIQYSISNILERILGDKGILQCFYRQNISTYVSCIFNHNLSDGKVYALLNQYVESAKTYLGLESVVGVCSSCKTFDSLKTLCSQSDTLCSLAITLKKQNVIITKEFLSPDSYLPDRQLIENLFKLMRTESDDKEVCETIDLILQDMIAHKKSKQTICLACTDILKLVIGDIRKNVVNSDIPSDWIDFNHRFKDCITTSDFYRCFTSTAIEIKQYVNQNNLSIGKKIVSKIKTRLENEYNSDPKLSMFASDYYMNQSYLSILFRQETGINYSQYLTKIRLEKAMYLLAETSFSTGKIAQLIGYKDRNYFANVFSKKFGMTPMQYRRAILSSDSKENPAAGLCL